MTVEASQPHARDALAFLLWPDSSDQVARTNLRSALANLRKILGDCHASIPYLLIDRATIQFNSNSDHWLDVTALSSLAFEPGEEKFQPELIEQALSLYQGPFLSGFSIGDSAPFEEWLLLKREQIDRVVISILYRVAAYYEERCEYKRAQSYAWKMVELEPWNEQSHQQLIRLLALDGQRSAALAQYDTCRQILAKELDVEPSQETTALYVAIREEHLEMLLPAPLAPTSKISATSVGNRRSSFVGRQTELAQLHGLLKHTLTGRGQIVFVTGSAGSGKSALIAEFLQQVTQTHLDLIAVAGNCVAYAGIGDPYLPFRQIMGLLTGDAQPKRLSSASATQPARRLWATIPVVIQALVEVGPGLIDRMISGSALIERLQTTPPGMGVRLDRLKVLVENQPADKTRADFSQIDLFEQFSRVMLTLARRGPLILVIDDLQWADAGSISLLFHLSRRLEGSRILIIGACRPEELALGRDGNRHPLESVLSEIQRDFGESRVDLDQSNGREFLEAYLDSEPNHLGSAFRQTLFHHTAGHPLFTIELICSLQERGALIKDATGCWIEGQTLSWELLPARVEAVIAERIERLPPELRRALAVASVEGKQFTAEVVAEVLSVEVGWLVQQFSETLERKHRLVAAGQFRRLDGRCISHYHFQHHLFQTYLYTSLDNVERAYYHERVGLALERCYRERPEELNGMLVQLARHFQEAGLPQKAIEYYRRAGERAERLSANEQAIAHFRAALGLCAQLPETLERAQVELELISALGAQLVATRGYLCPEVEQIFSHINRLYQQLGDYLAESRYPIKQIIPILIGLASFYMHLARFQQAREIYDNIIKLAQATGDPEALMVACWAPGCCLLVTGEFLSARFHLEKALEIYEPYKHKWFVTVFTLDMGVSCLSWLSWTLFFLGYPDQARQRSNEAIALARRLSSPFSLGYALAVACILRSYARDVAGARELAEESIAICREHGFLYWLGAAITYRGLAVVCLGEKEAGLVEVEEGLRIRRSSGVWIGWPSDLISLGGVLVDAGQVERARDVLAEGQEMIKQCGEVYLEAEIYRIKGDLALKLTPENQAEAEACYRQAIEIASKQQAKLLELRATTRLCRLMLVQGRRDEARELLGIIYSWFSEGFLTQDLQSASNLLVELA